MKRYVFHYSEWFFVFVFFLWFLFACFFFNTETNVCRHLFEKNKKSEIALEGCSFPKAASSVPFACQISFS